MNSAFDTNAATTLVIPSEVERSLALRLPRPLALLDEFPKLRFFAQLRVFCNRQFGAEKKISKRVLVQDAMDFDALVGLCEINPVILRAITIQLFPLALDHAKALRVEMIQILRQNLELGQQLELQFFRQRRDLGRAQLIEDDLEHRRSNINASDARANPCRDLPCDRARLLGQLRAGNFLVTIASH